LSDDEEDQDGGESTHDGWPLSFYGEKIIHLPMCTRNGVFGKLTPPGETCSQS
jgi:hypothetical protein